MPPRKPYSEMTPDELEATREYMRKKKMEQRDRNKSAGIKEKQYPDHRDRRDYLKVYRRKKKLGFNS